MASQDRFVDDFCGREALAESRGDGFLTEVGARLIRPERVNCTIISESGTSLTNSSDVAH